MKKFGMAVFAMACLGVVAAGCSNPIGQSSNEKDRKTAERQLATLSQSQPVPSFNWSQVRQNLIELETAQAQTTQTTTFFFNQGIQTPIMSCPSIGFPIPSTYQLTNPVQAETHGYQDAGTVTVGQIEAIGVYTGDSTGTYVICVDATGKAYANYWEGFVQTVTGPAVWNDSKKQVELTGPPSFDFTSKQK